MMPRGGWNFPGEDYPPPESVTIAGKRGKGRRPGTLAS